MILELIYFVITSIIGLIFYFRFLKNKNSIFPVYFYSALGLVFITLFLLEEEIKIFLPENLIILLASLCFVWLILLPILMYFIVEKKLNNKINFLSHLYIPIGLFIINVLTVLYFAFEKKETAIIGDHIEEFSTILNYLIILFAFPISTIFYSFLSIKKINQYYKLKGNAKLIYKSPLFYFILLYFINIIIWMVNLVVPFIGFKVLKFLYFLLSAYYLYKAKDYQTFVNLSTNSFDCKLDEIDLRLQKLLLEKKPYLNPELTIKELAKEINSNEKYLSKLINNKYEKSYSNFINELRVNHAKELLTNEEFNQYTIEAIGNLSGFNSKSSFNLIFKNITSLTPSEFKNK